MCIAHRIYHGIYDSYNLHYFCECVVEYTEALIDFHHIVAFINMYMYNMIQL